MLYSTCSIFKEENESQVCAFLERQTQAREMPLDGVQWGTARPQGRQILPGSDNMDGFYYALLTRCG
jgi:16S rRNA (cytosine967-C5)-methyltransferase